MPLPTLRNFITQTPSTLKLAAKLDRGRGGMRWLDEYPAPAKPRYVPDLSDWEDRDLSGVWIGHATVLLRIGGKTILTDPVFSNRIGLGLMLGTLGPRRKVAPAIPLKKLPPLDLILLSHAHFDHLDRPSLAKLDKKTPVIMASQTQDLIRDLGFRNITELRWGEKTEQAGLTITAREVVHWGSRVILDKYRGYNAYLIEAANHRVLFGGDSAFHEFYQDINGVDLAILGIGGYDPYIRAHASPEQAWQMANHAGAKLFLPIHHSTFRLSHEPNHAPVDRLLAAAGPEANRVVIREVGQSWTYGNSSR
jgi:L-ascorbate metabolism protein UlaG (beta-lactamase superfamily)